MKHKQAELYQKSLAKMATMKKIEELRQMDDLEFRDYYFPLLEEMAALEFIKVEEDDGWYN